jgi:hypothetical protein
MCLVMPTFRDDGGNQRGSARISWQATGSARDESGGAAEIAIERIDDDSDWSWAAYGIYIASQARLFYGGMCSMANEWGRGLQGAGTSRPGSPQRGGRSVGTRLAACKR